MKTGKAKLKAPYFLASVPDRMVINDIILDPNKKYSREDIKQQLDRLEKLMLADIAFLIAHQKTTCKDLTPDQQQIEFKAIFIQLINMANRFFVQKSWNHTIKSNLYIIEFFKELKPASIMEQKQYRECQEQLTICRESFINEKLNPKQQDVKVAKLMAHLPQSADNAAHVVITNETLRWLTAAEAYVKRAHDYFRQSLWAEAKKHYDYADDALKHIPPELQADDYKSGSLVWQINRIWCERQLELKQPDNTVKAAKKKSNITRMFLASIPATAAGPAPTETVASPNTKEAPATAAQTATDQPKTAIVFAPMGKKKNKNKPGKATAYTMPVSEPIIAKPAISADEVNQSKQEIFTCYELIKTLLTQTADQKVSQKFSSCADDYQKSLRANVELADLDAILRRLNTAHTKLTETVAHMQSRRGDQKSDQKSQRADIKTTFFVPVPTPSQKPPAEIAKLKFQIAALYNQIIDLLGMSLCEKPVNANLLYMDFSKQGISCYINNPDDEKAYRKWDSNIEKFNHDIHGQYIKSQNENISVGKLQKIQQIFTAKRDELLIDLYSLRKRFPKTCDYFKSDAKSVMPQNKI